MITEDYVSFELAKLLKEKGFEGKCNNSAQEMTAHYSDEWNCSFTETTDIPTLQMAMKWLREVHKIGVFPSTYAFMVGENGSAKPVYGTAIINLETYKLMTYDLMPMPTYEEATEAAIKYCLENLI